MTSKRLIVWCQVMFRFLTLVWPVIGLSASGCATRRTAAAEWGTQREQLLLTIHNIYAEQKVATTIDGSRVSFVATNTLVIPRWPWDTLLADGTLNIPSHPPADYRLLLNRDALARNALLLESQRERDGVTVLNLYGLYWNHETSSWSIISSWGRIGHASQAAEPHLSSSSPKKQI